MVDDKLKKQEKKTGRCFPNKKMPSVAIEHFRHFFREKHVIRTFSLMSFLKSRLRHVHSFMENQLRKHIEMCLS